MLHVMVDCLCDVFGDYAWNAFFCTVFKIEVRLRTCTCCDLIADFFYISSQPLHRKLCGSLGSEPAANNPNFTSSVAIFIGQLIDLRFEYFKDLASVIREISFCFTFNMQF